MISIHQSEFIPWVPYFYKILKSDIFIIMDDVQYQKNGVQNRNMIKTPTGASYVTIPVSRNSQTLINEVEITDRIYLDKFLKTLKNNYSKAQFFDDVYSGIESLITKNKYTKLNDLNNDIILLFLKLMKCDNVKIYYSSEFKLTSKKSDLVLDLISATKQKDYISGEGGVSYMDLNVFYKNNINIYIYSFEYKDYKQLWPKIGFIKDLSILDLLFNNLNNAKEYILNNGSLFLLTR